MQVTENVRDSGWAGECVLERGGLQGSLCVCVCVCCRGHWDSHSGGDWLND